jgi:hypothetical protein
MLEVVEVLVRVVVVWILRIVLYHLQLKSQQGTLVSVRTEPDPDPTYHAVAVGASCMVFTVSRGHLGRIVGRPTSSKYSEVVCARFGGELRKAE